MTKPITVRDRDGNTVVREDGVVRDGDSLSRPVHLMDAARPTPSAATLGHAARILGDAFNEDALARLSDAEARHAVVRQRLGAAAEGRSAAFLDAAWGTLAGTGAGTETAPAGRDMTVGSDAWKAMAQRGIERALADHAKRAPAGGQSRDFAAGSHDGMSARIADGWKSEPAPVPKLDARTEAAFRDGKIKDSIRNRALADQSARIANGWKDAAT